MERVRSKLSSAGEVGNCSARQNDMIVSRKVLLHKRLRCETIESEELQWRARIAWSKLSCVGYSFLGTP